MKHPSPAKLALHAGGDLGFADALRVRWHLSRCARCRGRVREFEQLRQETAEAALAPPPGLDWSRLESEMRANIRLGLAAGAIVDLPREDAEAAPEPRWRSLPVYGAWLPGAAVLASLALVVSLVWMLSHPPVSYAPELRAGGAGPVLTAQESGIEVRRQDAALRLLAPAAGHGTLSVALGAGARAEYVDADTGQVTIHQVFYADEE
jgi:hypothetical protein